DFGHCRPFFPISIFSISHLLLRGNSSRLQDANPGQAGM
ncbi:MAG: hypothetical protein AVDCRST_MAG56-7446, partial [uncultured Cytophagales bacterium]